MQLAIFLFACGVFLVVLEVIIPSMGLLTLMALACFGISVWQALDAAGPAAAWTMGVIAPILTIVILFFGLKYAPRTSWGRGLVLSRPEEQGARVPPSVSQTAKVTPQGGTAEARLGPLVGKEGVAHSDLRPVGIVLVDGQRVDCVTEGALIDRGARVRVVAVQGNRVVVRRVKV